MLSLRVDGTVEVPQLGKQDLLTGEAIFESVLVRDLSKWCERFVPLKLRICGISLRLIPHSRVMTLQESTAEWQ
jgi:hypothetical protein